MSSRNFVNNQNIKFENKKEVVNSHVKIQSEIQSEPFEVFKSPSGTP